MNAQTKTILVVGSGPTGLTLACELLRRGIPCRIIDKRATPSSHSKALGVSATSLIIFERLGFAKEFIHHNVSMQDTYFYWKGQRIGHTNYRYLSSTTHYPLMLLAHQTETERYLNDCLLKFGGCVERGVALTDFKQQDDGVHVQLRHENGQVETAFFEEVIGCDGSQSVVREKMGVDFLGQDYPFHFIYGDVELEGWTGNPTQAHYFFNDSHLLIMLPTINGIYRIVGLISGNPQQRPMPTIEDLQAYCDAFGPGNITLKNPTQFGSVPIYYRIANKVRDRHVFLAGDAFHLFSPLGGQGMNSGIQDAYNLAWKLAYVKQKKAQITLLDSYERERLPLVNDIVQTIKKTVEIIQRSDKEKDTMVQALLPRFSNRSYWREKLPKNYAGFNYRYAESAFIQNKLSGPSPTAGEYTCEKEFLHGTTEITLLIYLKTTPKQKLLPWVNKIKALYSFILIDYIESEEEKLTLIRPDGYIGYQDGLNGFHALLGYLKQWYINNGEVHDEAIR